MRDIRTRGSARCSNETSVFRGKDWSVGGKNEREGGGREKEKGGGDGTTIKQLKRTQRGRARGMRRIAREGPAKKRTPKREKKIGGDVDSNASRTRGPCSPGHNGPSTRNAFFELLSEALRSSLFGPGWPTDNDIPAYRVYNPKNLIGELLRRRKYKKILIRRIIFIDRAM